MKNFLERTSWVAGIISALVAVIVWMGSLKSNHEIRNPSQNVSANTQPSKVVVPHFSLTEKQRADRIERWRKDVQNCVKDGIFDREQFMMSRTYFEIAPYLSNDMNSNLIKNVASPMYAAERWSKNVLSHQIIVDFPPELKRIANEYQDK
jgi:hypothetical protein